MKLLISPERRARLIQEFHPGNKRGFIRMIIIIAIGVIIISVLGFDIRSAIENPQTQENFSYLGELLSDAWNKYLEPIWNAVWNIIGPGFEYIWSQAEQVDWSEYNTGIEEINSNAPVIENSSQ